MNPTYEKYKHLQAARYQVHKAEIWAKNIWRKFKLTVEQYNALDKEQAGGCRICGQPNDNGQRLSVDHDHKTGVVRSLLCTRCNLHVGFIENKPDAFANTVAYCRQHGILE